MRKDVTEAENLHVVDGPLGRHKLAVLRDERTRTPEFRQAMKELALIMVAEAARAMPTSAVHIKTPLAQMEVEKISGLHAVAAAPGAERVTNEHPDVNFYAAAVDLELDENAFIVPGLGDAGDRLYGTL